MEEKGKIDNYLSFDDGVVKLGNKILPGILVDMSIGGGIRFDCAQLDHMSGSEKVFMGWDDSDIRLTLDLLSDEEEKNGKLVRSTCYDKLAIINRFFKLGNPIAPMIYDFVNKHAHARNVHQVYFSQLESHEDDRDDVISATLIFTEYKPAVEKREKQANKVAAESKGAPVIKATPAASPAILTDTTIPFVSGYNAGMK